MSAIQNVELKVTDTVAAGTWAEMVVPTAFRYGPNQILTMNIEVPAPVGATEGVHQCAVYLRQGDLGAEGSVVSTFAQVAANHTDAVQVLGGRPVTALQEHTNTFPKNENAWMDQTSRIRYDRDVKLVVRYTNLTDADQTGERLVIVTVLDEN